MYEYMSVCGLKRNDRSFIDPGCYTSRRKEILFSSDVCTIALTIRPHRSIDRFVRHLIIF